MNLDDQRLQLPQEFTGRDSEDLACLLSPTVDVAALMLLKGHILVENWMDRFIAFLNSHEPRQLDPTFLRCLSPTAQKLLCQPKPWNIPLDMSYCGKLQFLAQHGLLPKANAQALERLNRVRNAFAHDFEKTISLHDVRSILQPLLEDEGGEGLRQELAELPEDVVSHLRFALLALLMQLFMFLVGISKIDDVLKMFQNKSDK